MNTEKNLDLARKYAGALCAGDFAKVRPLLHDKLSFKGPMETISGADKFIETVTQHLGPIAKGATIHQAINAGNRVVLSYDFVTNSPAGSLPITEWFEIVDGKITSIELYFDPRPLMALMKQGG